jgi:hypothetical protein
VCPILENSTACTMFNANFIPRPGFVIWLGFLWKLMSVMMSYLLEVKLDFLLFGVGCRKFFYGEFDPGSGRTLAACLTHASRTMKPSLLGGLVANG